MLGPAAMAMVAGPLVIVVGDLFVDSRGRIAAALFVVGFLLLAPAVIGLGLLVGEARGTLRDVGVGLAVLGCLTSAGDTTLGLVGFDFPIDFEILSLPLNAGLVLLAIGLLLAGTAPTLLALALIPASLIGPIVNSALSIDLSYLVADGLLLVALGGIGALCLAGRTGPVPRTSA